MAANKPTDGRYSPDEKVYDSFGKRAQALYRPLYIREQILYHKAIKLRHEVIEPLIDTLLEENIEDCQQLCDYMQRHLPTELRDMVYDYLLDDACKYPIVVSPTMDLVEKHTLGYRLRGSDSPNPCKAPKYEGITPPFWHKWDFDYTGAETGHELRQHWVKLSTFCFRFETSIKVQPGIMRDFLSSNIWGIGRTMWHVVTKLDLTLYYPPNKYFEDTLVYLGALPQLNRPMKLSILVKEGLPEDLPEGVPKDSSWNMGMTDVYVHHLRAHMGWKVTYILDCSNVQRNR